MIEYAIPKPLPFLRLGLANLPVVVAVKRFRARDVALLALCKSAGQAVVSGTLLSYVFVFSFAGSLASAVAALLVYSVFRKLKLLGAVSNVSLCLAGAIASTGAQLCCSKLMVFGENTRYIAPVLLISGSVTALCLGLWTNVFERASRFVRFWSGELEESEVRRIVESLPDTHDGIKIETSGRSNGSLYRRGTAFFIAVLIVLLPFAVARFSAGHGWSGVFLALAFAVCFFTAGCILRHGRVKVLPSLTVVIGVTFFALFSPSGRVFVRLGTFAVTEGAVRAGLSRSLVLVGMIFASQCVFALLLPAGTIPSRLASSGLASALSRILAVLGELTSRRLSFKRGHIIETLDGRLVEVYAHYCKQCK